MQKTVLSARAAAAYLGFATSNPILEAIHLGELPAERGRPGRNGQAGNFRIQIADLDKWAATHGLELSDGSVVHMPEPIAEASVEPEAATEPLPQLMPAAPIVGLVTVPLARYDALVAAEGELKFLRAHFELRWNGVVS